VGRDARFQADGFTEIGEEQMMLRRFPVAVAATALALSLTAHAPKAEDAPLGQIAEQLKTALSDAPVQVTQEVVAIVITSGADAMFPEGGHLIAANSPVLSKMLPALSQLRNTRIVVGGYTDNTPIGPQLQQRGISDNLDLSARRAVSVVNFLISHGVNPNLVSAQAFGETHPVAPNNTSEGRAKNRRVDITLTGDGT
jgi:chemotaxis protein MotB